MQFILYSVISNSHKECYYVYLMHTHILSTYIQYLHESNFKESNQAHLDLQSIYALFKSINTIV